MDTTPSLPRSDRTVSLGLALLAAGVFGLALVGAITRLTESGLSIMEWAPIRGILPPFGEDDWRALFARYKETGEYAAAPSPPTLESFRAIFWWEWLHRIWGRALGLLLLAVAAWFAAKRVLRPRVAGLLALVFGLAALQGVAGWYMVASGFSARADVAPLRLVFHLVLALVIYALLCRGAFRAWPQAPPFAHPTELSPRATTNAHRLAIPWRILLLALFLVIASGGLVAGSNAGFLYNDWPLMEGAFVPRDYAALSPWQRNLSENPAAVQFHHRWLAAALAVFGFALSFRLWRAVPRPRPRAFYAPAVALAAQFLLGIWTLLAVVPVWLGALHQAGALLLLTSVLWLLESLRRSGRASG